MTNMKTVSALALFSVSTSRCQAWIPTHCALRRQVASGGPLQMVSGNAHGENNCFMPCTNLDQDYYAPRIIQIAGSYPGITLEEFTAVTSEEASEQGQWSYDFSDPDGPQVGTVAIQGNELVATMVDPAVIIAEHTSIGIKMPEELVGPVDIVCVVDRAENGFKDRQFLIFSESGKEDLSIAAFNLKTEMPEGSNIVGWVKMVQIPWLPGMKPTKTGILEVDEYF